MKTISITDITVSHAGKNLSFREKIELAKLLDRLGLSVIEMGPVTDRRIDSLLVKSVASSVRDSVLAVPVSLMDAENVSAVWAALSGARHPRLQVPAPVSTVQMEYFCHKKTSDILTLIRERVEACRELCPEVEFIAEDAGRAEPGFLQEVLETAAAAGAGIVTVCDDAGRLLPDEYHEHVRSIRAFLPEGVKLGVRCANTLYMADSCAVAAVRAGADEVKTAACGEDTVSLERFAVILRDRGEEFEARSGIRTTELRRTVSQIQWMASTERSATSPFDSGVRDGGDGLELTVHDDLNAVAKATAALGYDLSEEDLAKVYEAFTRIAAKKDRVGEKELDVIVASTALQVPPTYRIDSYVVNSGSVLTSTSHIRMKKGEQTLDGLACGDGPIDASFLAIEQIVGHHYELDDFQIQAVTEGREAMGETVVRLRSGGRVYSGRGISTDIIGASIRAYVAALNKIVYEEAEA